MYALIRRTGIREGVFVEAPSFAASLIIAERVPGLLCEDWAV